MRQYDHTPRPYQIAGERAINEAWQNGARNVLYTLPTGSGKTFLFSRIVRSERAPSCVIAHRSEIIGQISLALAKNQVYHRIVGPPAMVRMVCRIHQEELGRVWYDAAAPCGVASVKTLNTRARDGKLENWLQRVTHWVHDEAHRVQEQNEYGKAIALFPNARGLGVTGTPERTDGNGLGRGHGGVFDVLLEGPGAAELMDMGYLSRYRIICPPTTGLDLTGCRAGTDGDYIAKPLALATQKSSIMGDVVAYYKKYAEGELGLTFAPDIETAKLFAERYVAAGIPARVVTGKTPELERLQIVRDFKARRVLNLVNVDLFDEGVDIPACRVVSMARKTLSLIKYRQQFGRALRPEPGKTAIIIDHVGNSLNPRWVPDAHRVWSLAARDKRSAASDGPSNRVCTECLGPFSRALSVCPYCGAPVAAPAVRSSPDLVDGDLYELDAEALAQLRGEIERIDEHPDAVLARMRQAMPYPAAKGAANQHGRRQDVQSALREAVALWAGYRRAGGHSDRDSYKYFYFKYGVDVLSAQSLGRPQAEVLTARVMEELGGWL